MRETAAVLGMPVQEWANQYLGAFVRDLNTPDGGMLATYVDRSDPAAVERFKAWAIARGTSAKELASMLPASPPPLRAKNIKAATKRTGAKSKPAEPSSLIDRAADIIAESKRKGWNATHVADHLLGLPNAGKSGLTRIDFAISRDAADRLAAFAKKKGIRKADIIRTVLALKASDDMKSARAAA